MKNMGQKLEKWAWWLLLYGNPLALLLNIITAIIVIIIEKLGNNEKI
jgi:hypothetical protein